MKVGDSFRQESFWVRTLNFTAVALSPRRVVNYSVQEGATFFWLPVCCFYFEPDER